MHLTPADIGLLKAALLGGDEGRAGYAVWRAALDFDSISYGHQRLLPLLDDNLPRLGIADPLMQRFRGIRRFFWVRNLRALAFAKGVFATLDQRGIPFIVLKGAALMAEDGALHSLRPMDDIDIMVPRDRLLDVIGILASFDLRPERYAAADLLTSEVLDRRAGWGFSKPGHNIDVHWRALHLDLRPQADDAFWKGSRAGNLDGTPVRVLDPADQLLNICAHAYQAHAGAAAQYWPADAVLVIRRHPDLSYRRLIEAAEEHRLSAVIGDALAFLAGELGQPVPSSVVAALTRAGSTVERAEMRYRQEAPRRTLSTREQLLLAFQDYRRSDRLGFEPPVMRPLRGFARRRAGTAHFAPALLAAAGAAFGHPPTLRRLLGRDRHRQVIGRRRLPRLGESLDLTDRRGIEAPFIAGWSGGEPTGRWTDGVEVVTAWLIEQERRALVLAVEGFPLVNARAPDLTVEVWANDAQIATWRFTHGMPMPLPAKIRLTPRDIGRNSDLLILTFVIRAPRSPTSIGLPSDPRLLGLHITGMTLSVAE